MVNYTSMIVELCTHCLYPLLVRLMWARRMLSSASCPVKKSFNVIFFRNLVCDYCHCTPQHCGDLWLNHALCIIRKKEVFISKRTPVNKSAAVERYII